MIKGSLSLKKKKLITSATRGLESVYKAQGEMSFTLEGPQKAKFWALLSSCMPVLNIDPTLTIFEHICPENFFLESFIRILLLKFVSSWIIIVHKNTISV